MSSTIQKTISSNAATIQNYEKIERQRGLEGSKKPYFLAVRKFPIGFGGRQLVLIEENKVGFKDILHPTLLAKRFLEIARTIISKLFQLLNIDKKDQKSIEDLKKQTIAGIQELGKKNILFKQFSEIVVGTKKEAPKVAKVDHSLPEKLKELETNLRNAFDKITGHEQRAENHQEVVARHKHEINSLNGHIRELETQLAQKAKEIEDAAKKTFHEDKPVEKADKKTEADKSKGSHEKHPGGLERLKSALHLGGAKHSHDEPKIDEPKSTPVDDQALKITPVDTKERKKHRKSHVTKEHGKVPAAAV